MREPSFDALRLDVQAFVQRAAVLEGHWPQESMPRLSSSLTATLADSPPPPVRWSARGELRPVTAGRPELWLHLTLSTTVSLQCQRCLAPMLQPLEAERSFRFVADEDEAERLDAESEDDVLALPRWLNLAELAEDELILALPLVPRHETCPQPLAAIAAEPEEPRHRPFAALGSLRAPRSKP